MTARIRLGRLFGIPIGVQPAWLAIVALIAWSLGAGYYPEQDPGIAAPAAYALGLASALLLFAGVLAHELGHALVARRRGVEIEEIDLWLLGGVARMSGQPARAADEILFAAAGPAVTLLLTIVFACLAIALPGSTPDAVIALVQYLAFVNAAILALNLLPAFPLDGGRIARGVIWLFDGDLRKATVIAARLGRGIGWALVALGTVGAMFGYLTGFWAAIIGVFVIFAAKAEERATRLRAALAGRRAGSLATPFPGGPLEIDLQLRDVDPELIVDADTDLADLAERPAFIRAGQAFVRSADGGVGIVSAADLETLVRAVELGAKPQRARRERADGEEAAGRKSGPIIRSGIRKAHR